MLPRFEPTRVFSQMLLSTIAAPMVVPMIGSARSRSCNTTNQLLTPRDNRETSGQRGTLPQTRSRNLLTAQARGLQRIDSTTRVPAKIVRTKASLLLSLHTKLCLLRRRSTSSRAHRRPQAARILRNVRFGVGGTLLTISTGINRSPAPCSLACETTFGLLYARTPRQRCS